ncbi:MAG: hypothetical protein OHK0031_00710 [Anaerolineales bacterium]
MTKLRVIVVFFLSLALLSGLFAANFAYTSRFKGGLDFAPLWQGARNFLFQGLTPYGELTALNAQNLVYGRAARPLENHLRPDQPLFLLLLYSPLAAIASFGLARALWMTALELALAALIFLSLQLTGWRPRPLTWLPLLIFSLAAFPTLTALQAASPVIPLALTFLAALWAIARRTDEAAGFLLAFTLIYAENSLPALLFLLLWSLLSDRRQIAAAFGMTLVLAFSVTQLLSPGWMNDFFRAAFINFRFYASASTFSLFEKWFPAIGSRLAWGLTFATLLMLGLETVLALRRDSRWLFWTFSLFLCASPLLGLPFPAPQRLFLFLPASLLIASIMDQRWGGWGRLAALTVFGLIFAALWAQSFFNIQNAFLWLSPLMLILLYWVRWWAARPARLWADQLSEMDAHDPR